MMETLVTSYLSKKLSSNGPSAKVASFSESPILYENHLGDDETRSILGPRMNTNQYEGSRQLESSSRVQGLLSGGISFTRAGPQNDPWLDVLAKMPCKTLSSTGPTNQRVSQGEPTSLSTSNNWNSPATAGATSQVILGKAQKRPLNSVIGGCQQGTAASHLKQQKQDQGPSSGTASKVVCSVVLRNSGSRVQVGLTNVGNTCYFNAMLQCLTNCKPFYNYIRSETHDRTICKRGDQCVLCLLKSFCVSQMPVNPNEKVVSGGVLRDLLVKMRTAVRRWKIHSHQSVDEILSYVLDSMWDRDMAYFGVINRQHTPMMGLFGTLVEQQYACSLCGEASISTVVEPTLILGLVNGDRRSVQDRLRMEYGLTETLSEPKSKCDACGRSRTPRPTMKRVLKNLPMILVVMLKRFYVIDGISHKINQFVQFPESLDLRPCMDTSGTTQNSLYRLSGVVEHWGKSVTDGHYVAYCKNYCQQRRTEAWFCLNDRQVRIIDSREVLQKQAYLLFYTVQGQAMRTIDTVSPVKASVINGNGESSSVTTAIREAKVTKISPVGQQAGLKVTKLIPSKYVPIVVLKKAIADRNGAVPASGGLDSSTQVTFTKSHQQRTSGLPFVNGSGPTALKSPTVKISGASSAQLNGNDDDRSVSSRNGRDSAGFNMNGSLASGDAVGSSGFDASQQQLIKGPVGNGHRTTSPTAVNASIPRKSLFGNLSPKLASLTDKVFQNERRNVIRSSLVPYASSSSSSSNSDDEGSSDENGDGRHLPATPNGNSNSSSTLGRGVVSALPMSVPRAASSSGWVVDKLNDAPSVNSNTSSQNSSSGSFSNNTNNNSSVHGTSPGWSITQETHSTTTATATTTSTSSTTPSSSPTTTAAPSTVTTTASLASSSQSQMSLSTTGVNGGTIRGVKVNSSCLSAGNAFGNNSGASNGSSHHQQQIVNSSPGRQSPSGKTTPTSWAKVSNGTVGTNGIRSPSVPTVSYTPRMPPGSMQQQQQQNTRTNSNPDGSSRRQEGNSTPALSGGNATREVAGSLVKNSQNGVIDKLSTNSKEKPDEPNTNGSSSSSSNGGCNRHRDGGMISYWGANLNDNKDERELYDEEIDQGRQKKKPILSWKNPASRWNNKHLQQNPFQREQDQRLRNGNGVPGVIHNTHFKKLHHRQNQHHFISGNAKQKLYRWHRGGVTGQHSSNGHHNMNNNSNNNNNNNGSYHQHQHHSKAQHDNSNGGNTWHHQNGRNVR